ncbi:uncharacterized protein V6R79_005821 [Siganus canaliculatus]
MSIQCFSPELPAAARGSRLCSSCSRRSGPVQQDQVLPVHVQVSAVDVVLSNRIRSYLPTSRSLRWTWSCPTGSGPTCPRPGLCGGRGPVQQDQVLPAHIQVSLVDVVLDTVDVRRRDIERLVQRHVDVSMVKSFSKETRQKSDHAKLTANSRSGPVKTMWKEVKGKILVLWELCVSSVKATVSFTANVHSVHSETVTWRLFFL